jgi:hypothetical protein
MSSRSMMPFTSETLSNTNPSYPITYYCTYAINRLHAINCSRSWCLERCSCAFYIKYDYILLRASWVCVVERLSTFLEWHQN